MSNNTGKFTYSLCYSIVLLVPNARFLKGTQKCLNNGSDRSCRADDGSFVHPEGMRKLLCCMHAGIFNSRRKKKKKKKRKCRGGFCDPTFDKSKTTILEII